MTTGLRRRILVLQVGLIVVLGFCAGCLFAGSHLVNSTVQDQLSAQQITFPAAGSAALKALPAADDAAMTAYAGQTLSTGAQAETYANNFIAIHLTEIYKGETYSQISSAAMAAPAGSALATTLNADKTTSFMGNSLRSMLLNAWGWSQVGTYTSWAGIGLAIATVVVLLAFVYELAIAPRRETERVTVPGRRGAPSPA